MSTYHSVYFVG